MKHLCLLKVGVLLVVLIGLTACAPKVTTQQPTEASSQAPAEVETPVVIETPVVNDPPAEDPIISTTPTIDGDALVREKLENHHSIDRIYGVQHTREEWNVILDRMIGYGAKISEEEKGLLIDYLLSRQ